MKTPVSYSGFFGSYSGMAEAARNIVASLNAVGVDVTTQFIPNIQGTMNLGVLLDIVKSLQARQLDYKVKIMHVTPDLITQHLEPMKYHIFHLFWETDALPKWWVWALNLCDEVWTGDQYHAEAFRKSGVKKPIFVFPQPIEENADKPPFSYLNKINRNSLYMFYSIFQWIERKDPKTLIKAYLREFENEKDVILLFKTYKETFSSQEIDDIMSQVVIFKRELQQKHYPRLGFIQYPMNKHDVLRFHVTGDCFVLPHRGEGWARTVQEAALFGKPIISTKLGGVHEYLPDDSAYLLNYEEVNVFNMDWVPWYSKEQKWAQVDQGELQKKMRHAFENRHEARSVGAKAAQLILRDMNYQAVGNLMKRRLEEIYQNL